MFPGEGDMKLATLAVIPVIVFAAAINLSGAEPELTVVTENWRPYNYLENNEVKGESTEIVKKVLDRAGIRYTISVYPWSRAYYMASKNKNVLIYTIIRIPQRESLFKWIRPVGRSGVTSLYRLKSKTGIAPRNLQEAKKYSIAVNKDSMDYIWLKDRGFDKLYIPPAVENSVKMFFFGRSDLIAFDSKVINEEFQSAGFSTTDVVKVLDLFGTPPYMAVSISTPDDIVLKLQKAYDELAAEGSLISH